MKDYMSKFWGPKRRPEDLAQELAELVNGEYNMQSVLDHKGKLTRRIVISYEDPSDN